MFLLPSDVPIASNHFPRMGNIIPFRELREDYVGNADHDCIAPTWSFFLFDDGSLFVAYSSSPSSELKLLRLLALETAGEVAERRGSVPKGHIVSLSSMPSNLCSSFKAALNDKSVKWDKGSEKATACSQNSGLVPWDGVSCWQQPRTEFFSGWICCLVRWGLISAGPSEVSIGRPWARAWISSSCNVQ